MLNEFFTVTTEITRLPTFEKRIENCTYGTHHDVSCLKCHFPTVVLYQFITYLCTYLVINFLHFMFSTADDKDTIRPPGMGRITGSASIETLVRVGIEKENGLSPDSKMIVLHDFTPCVDDELEVKQGNVSPFVNIFYCAIHNDSISFFFSRL